MLSALVGVALAVGLMVAPADAYGASTPPVRVITGIAYAPPQPAASQGHLLDLYLPQGTRRPTPLVIWTAGSGWMAENGRLRADVVAAELNPRGYAVAGVSIRSSGFAQFPG
jgi:acetyl esterase/lipase